MANLWSTQYAGSRSQIDIASYLSGYFDGEGCFAVSISPRSTLRVGWEVRPSVSVSQNATRREVLDLAMEHFGCGTIRRDPGDKTVKWEVRSLQVIRKNVIPHFREYPLLSGKQRDVDALAEVCDLMARDEHRTPQGLISIVEIVKGMNPSGTRRFDPETIKGSVSEMKA